MLVIGEFLFFLFFRLFVLGWVVDLDVGSWRIYLAERVVVVWTRVSVVEMERGDGEDWI